MDCFTSYQKFRSVGQKLRSQKVSLDAVLGFFSFLVRHLQKFLGTKSHDFMLLWGSLGGCNLIFEIPVRDPYHRDKTAGISLKGNIFISIRPLNYLGHENLQNKIKYLLAALLMPSTCVSVRLSSSLTKIEL